LFSALLLTIYSDFGSLICIAHLINTGHRGANNSVAVKAVVDLCYTWTYGYVVPKSDRLSSHTNHTKATKHKITRYNPSIQKI